MHQLMSFLLTSSDIRYILPHMLLIHADSFTDFPEASPFSVATALLSGQLFHHKHTAVLLLILGVSQFTLTQVFHDLQKWNLTVDSGSSPKVALSVYGLRGHFIGIWNF